MSPFSPSVWIYLGIAYITVSLCFFCLGRISPSQWENRYPCIEEPTYLENQFTLNNAMWFAAGALLQQGSEIEPKYISQSVENKCKNHEKNENILFQSCIYTTCIIILVVLHFNYGSPYT